MENLNLRELLEQMNETAGNPETSTAFHQAHDLYTRRIILIQSEPSAYRKEIRDAKAFFETNSILGLNHENMVDQIEELELAIN